MYQEMLYRVQPDVLLETGTSGGGSAFFFATLFEMMGKGRVVTCDVMSYPELYANHPRITYLHGDSTGDHVMHQMRSAAEGCAVVVSLDSNHDRANVVKELEANAPLVSVGGYIVVEDVGMGVSELSPATVQGEWGDAAALDFMMRNPGYVRDEQFAIHLLTSNLWLRRDR
jgi:cephalosporin hydroxylase